MPQKHDPRQSATADSNSRPSSSADSPRRNGGAADTPSDPPRTHCQRKPRLKPPERLRRGLENAEAKGYRRIADDPDVLIGPGGRRIWCPALAQIDGRTPIQTT